VESSFDFALHPASLDRSRVGRRTGIPARRRPTPRLREAPGRRHPHRRRAGDWPDAEWSRAVARTRRVIPSSSLIPSHSFPLAPYVCYSPDARSLIPDF